MENINTDYDKIFFTKVTSNPLYQDFMSHNVYNNEEVAKSFGFENFGSEDVKKIIESMGDIKIIYDHLSFISSKGKNLAEEFEMVLRRMIIDESNPIIRIYFEHEIDTRIGRNSDTLKLADVLAPELISYYKIDTLGSYDENVIIAKYGKDDYNEVTKSLNDLHEKAAQNGEEKLDAMIYNAGLFGLTNNDKFMKLLDNDSKEYFNEHFSTETIKKILGKEGFIKLLNDDEIDKVCEPSLELLDPLKTPKNYEHRDGEAEIKRTV